MNSINQEMKMTKKQLLQELQEQDEILNKIFARREEIAKISRDKGFYNDIWKSLISDKNTHWSF